MMRDYGIEFDDYMIFYLGQAGTSKAKVEYLDDWARDESIQRKIYQHFCHSVNSSE
jgi:hypothetical protein